MEEGQIVEVYNEANLVFLFDAGFLEEVKQADPEFVEGGKPFQAKLFEPLFQKGKILVYDLYQDDSAVVKVMAGQPLSESELPGVAMLPAVSVPLSLPTGRLRVETLNTLMPDGDEPGIVQVAPGQYVATLYRVDWENAGINHYSEIGWIEAIVLTPEREYDGELDPVGFICRHDANFNCAGD